MKLNNFFKLVIAVSISELAGVIGSIFTISAIPGWYATLAKPELSPPSWLFGPVWITLYALMGVSLFLIWEINPSEARSGERRRAVALFFIQLSLNAIWSIVFFGLRSPLGALVVIIFLWLAIVGTMIAFFKISRPAAYLLAPYLLWVSFAAYLNYSIWTLN